MEKIDDIRLIIREALAFQNGETHIDIENKFVKKISNHITANYITRDEAEKVVNETKCEITETKHIHSDYIKRYVAGFNDGVMITKANLTRAFKGEGKGKV